MTRQITSCLTCRRRKVRCDRLTPICATCQKGNYVCNYQSSNPMRMRSLSPPPEVKTVQSRVSKARLHEKLRQTKHTSYDYQGIDSSESCKGSPQFMRTSSDAEDGYGKPCGVLLLDDECSRLVSPLHWASTDEVKRWKQQGCTYLDQAASEAVHAVNDVVINPSRSNDRADIAQQCDNAKICSSYDGSARPSGSAFAHLLLGSPMEDKQTAPYYPDNVADCRYLLEVFFKSIEAVTHLFHEPTLKQLFDANLAHLGFCEPLTVHARRELEKPSHFEPLAFGLFYSAVHSMDATMTQAKFGKTKEDLMNRFQKGLVLALEKEDFLCSPAIPVLQAFVLFITCRCRDDDMQHAWALIGIAVRIAQSLGLHQEPTLYPANEMDAIQVEIRRRLWYQIFHLDFRAAVSQGLPSLITSGSYTTRLPSNVDDEDLVPGQSPLPDHYDPDKFTGMTMQLVRLNGIRSMQQLLSMVPPKAQTMRCGPATGQSADRQIGAIEEQEMRLLIETTLEKNQMLYIRHCDYSIPLHRLVLSLSNHIKWKFWITYYYRFSDGLYRPLLPAQKTLIFSQSLNLMESYSRMNKDKELDPFRWMIDSHSSLHATSYVIQQLEDSENEIGLEPELLQRGKQLLRAMQDLKSDSESKAWSILNKRIDCLLSPVPDQTVEETRVSDLGSSDFTSIINDVDISGINDWTKYLNDAI